jgi:hypothetical protein
MGKNFRSREERGEMGKQFSGKAAQEFNRLEFEFTLPALVSLKNGCRVDTKRAVIEVNDIRVK